MGTFSLVTPAVGTPEKGEAMSANLDRQLVQGLFGFCGSELAFFNDCDDDGAVPVLLGYIYATGERVAMTTHDFLVHNSNYQGF